MNEAQPNSTSPSEEHPSRAGSPRRALTIIHAGRHGTTGLEHIIADLIDALRAYERASSSRAGSRGVQPLEIDLQRLEDADDRPSPRSAPSRRRSALIVVSTEDLTDRMRTRIASLVQDGGCEGVYVLAGTDEPGPDEAIPALDRLENDLARTGTAYRGAAVLCGALLFERHVDTPRMGRARRARSEQIDRVIGALRIGCPIALLPDTGGANTLVAPCPLPSFAYRALTGR